LWVAFFVFIFFVQFSQIQRISQCFKPIFSKFRKNLAYFFSKRIFCNALLFPQKLLPVLNLLHNQRVAEKKGGKKQASEKNVSAQALHAFGG